MEVGSYFANAKFYTKIDAMQEVFPTTIPLIGKTKFKKVK